MSEVTQPCRVCEGRGSYVVAGDGQEELVSCASCSGSGAVARREPEVVTSSRLVAYRLCKRLHWYKYIRLRRPRRVAKPLAFGTVVHAALAAWWLAYARGAGEDEALADALEALVAAFRELAEDLEEMDLVKADVMVRGYHLRWWEPPGSRRWVVAGVERSLRAPLVNPATKRASVSYVRGGKLDGLLRDVRTGELWILEHKTTSGDLSPESVYWRKLRMDGQVSTYFALAQTMLSGDERVRGCLYDVLAKPQQRQLAATPEEARKTTKGKKCKACKGTGEGPYVAGSQCAECGGSGWAEPPKLYANQRDQDESLDDYAARVAAAIAEAPDQYYARAEVVRLEAEVEEHAADDWSTAKSMHEERQAGRFPRNVDACFRGNDPCPYWNVCCGAEDVANDAVFRDARPNEEL